MKNIDVSPSLKYFFRAMEKKVADLDEQRRLEAGKIKVIPFDGLEQFFRSLKTQSIFINTIGVNGKPVSMLLEKAVFNLNQVIRIYYSTSFDEFSQGFVRIQISQEQNLILVERMHGERPKPESMYASQDENKVIRFMVRWLLRRIDWDKTKLSNLDLYNRYIEIQQEELEAKLAREQEILEERRTQAALGKGFR